MNHSPSEGQKYTAGNTATFIMYKKRVFFYDLKDVKVIDLVGFGFKSKEQNFCYTSHTSKSCQERIHCVFQMVSSSPQELNWKMNKRKEGVWLFHRSSNLAVVDKQKALVNLESMFQKLSVLIHYAQFHVVFVVTTVRAQRAGSLVLASYRLPASVWVFHLPSISEEKVCFKYSKCRETE